MRTFIIRISSWDYRDWEVPQSAIHKLKSRTASDIIQSESEGPRIRGPHGVTPVQGQMLENQGAAGVSLRVWRSENQEFQCARTVEDEHPAHKEKERTSFSSDFLFSFGPQWVGWCPPTLVTVNLIIWSTKLNANFSQKHPHLSNTPRSNVLPA